MEDKVDKVIEIAPDSKYVLVVSASNIHKLERIVHKLTSRIRDWWETSNSPILVLGTLHEGSIKLVKVDDEAEKE